jgi:pilus assembly protein Flp/PilA
LEINIMRIPKKEEGQGLVEYALLLVLVAIVIVVILALMGRAVTAVYAQIYAGLNGQAVDGSGTEYVVTGVNASATGTGLCTVTVSGTVVVFEDGDLAEAGVGVSGAASWSGGSGGSVSGTTNSSGTASVGPASGPGNCSGQARINVGGNTKTVSYGN